MCSFSWNFANLWSWCSVVFLLKHWYCLFKLHVLWCLNSQFVHCQVKTWKIQQNEHTPGPFTSTDTKISRPKFYTWGLKCIYTSYNIRTCFLIIGSNEDGMWPERGIYNIINQKCFIYFINACVILVVVRNKSTIKTGHVN